jgi:phytol kinase
MIPALKRGVGSVLHGVERPSYGELLFAPSVAVVFQWSQGNALLHLIPILILTLADAAGAMAGTRWGKRRYGSGEGFKSAEGSIIFLITAFLCVWVPLVFVGRMDSTHAFWIAMILATLGMMAEGLSDRGFDNLVLPVGGVFVLERLLVLDTALLAGRFVVLILLLILVIRGGRWSSLSGGALLGSALLGYGCAVIADWRFALPPVAVFICHLATTRQHGLSKVFDHRLDAVLCHAISCVPWVLAMRAGWITDLTALAGVSFSMACQLAILDSATRAWLDGKELMPVRSCIKGWLIAAVPGLIWFWPDFHPLWIPVSVGFGAALIATLIFERIRTRYRGHETGLWMIKGGLALSTSFPALFIKP